MLELPRSARLAAWGVAVLDGRTTPGAVLAALHGEDEPHTVSGDSPSGEWSLDADALVPGLAELLVALEAGGCTSMRLVLPAPGDAIGLSGPAQFNALAVAAGECVLAGPGRRGTWWGLVPDITSFGSAWEPGTLVEWRVVPVPPPHAVPPTDLRSAERELRLALADAAGELDRLEVGSWREDAAERLSELRAATLRADGLPPGSDPRGLAVLALATRVRAIVALAGEDDGAAISGWEVQQRTRALRELDTVSRRAVVAAVNSLAR